MKLRNKENGEIVEITMPIKNGDGWSISANSLAELNADWEDYEEPKDFWYLEPDGCIERDNLGVIECNIPKEYHYKMVEIGNHFETKEEAEKAVEKLKAWKRLKDKGFRFKRYNKYSDILEGAIGIEAQFGNDGQADKDLDLLFGGEE